MNTETMILTGEGYALTITPEAEIQKSKLLDVARAVKHVRSNDESGEASFHMRSLAQMRIAVDKSRKEIKEPVLRIGKLIDDTAKNFLAEIEDEEQRIRKLIGDHANEMLRLKKEAEEKERIAFEAERSARELAESGGIAAVIEARDALQDKMRASEEVITTKVAQGVRFVWDFEVTSIQDLIKFAPDLVKVEPKRREIIAWLKGLEENEDRDAAAVASQVGIVAYKIPSISTR
jgi:hypothetical protein